MKRNPRNNLHNWWSTHWLLTHSEHLKGHMTAGSAILLDEFVPVELHFPLQVAIRKHYGGIFSASICNLFWLCAESEHVWENGSKTFPQNITTTKLLLEENYYYYYDQHYTSRNEFPVRLRGSCTGPSGCNNSQNVERRSVCAGLVGGASVIGDILQAAQQGRMAVGTNPFGWRLLLQWNASLSGGRLPSPDHAVDLLEALGRGVRGHSQSSDRINSSGGLCSLTLGGLLEM